MKDEFIIRETKHAFSPRTGVICFVLNVRTTKRGIGMGEVYGANICGFVEMQRSGMGVGDGNKSSHERGGELCFYFIVG